MAETTNDTVADDVRAYWHLMCATDQKHLQKAVLRAKRKEQVHRMRALDKEAT